MPLKLIRYDPIRLWRKPMLAKEQGAKPHRFAELMLPR
jgi:hypothetical protein